MEGRALSDDADDQAITVTYTWGDLDVAGVTTATVQARPGNSSAQVEVFTYTTDQDTGISTYDAERLAPVGGTVGLALRVHVGAGAERSGCAESGHYQHQRLDGDGGLFQV
ncbi:MAG TPA: hypothetical protein PLZ36_08270 [Armatimonadota bacterium]|nr:hypothetical protein [Armatimonadota bacterium]